MAKAAELPTINQVRVGADLYDVEDAKNRKDLTSHCADPNAHPSILKGVKEEVKKANGGLVFSVDEVDNGINIAFEPAPKEI